MAFLLVVAEMEAPKVRPALATAFGKAGHDEMKRRAPGGVGVRIAQRGTRLLILAEDDTLSPILVELAGELSRAGHKVSAAQAVLEPTAKPTSIKGARRTWTNGKVAEDAKGQAEAEALFDKAKKDGTLTDGTEGAVEMAVALIGETRAGTQRWSHVMFKKRPEPRHLAFVHAIEAGEEVTLEEVGGRRAARRKVMGGSSHLAVLDDEGIALVEAALKKRKA
jgi:hypothetical protein